MADEHKQALDKLTGIERKRLLYGEWCAPTVKELEVEIEDLRYDLRTLRLSAEERKGIHGQISGLSTAINRIKADYP